MNSTQSIENIVIFLNNLRDQGLLVGVAEADDTIRLLTTIGLADRELVKASLMATLAKSPKEQRIFNAEFDEFFIGKQERFVQKSQEIADEDKKQQKIEDARASLEGYDVPVDIAEAYAEASTERKEWLKNMLDYAHDGNRNLPLMKSYLKKIASGWIASEAGIGVEAPEEEELLHKDLSTISEEEAAQALRLIEILVRRIHLAAERKHKKNARRGMPDVRATIHRSLRTGGIPVNPVYKRRPRNSKRIVILCDISESMYKYSEFALKFITAMGRNHGKIHAFMFSEETEEISLSDLSNFEKIVKSSNLWRRGTNCGAAMEYLLGLKPAVISPSTLLIVLSDAKTVDQPYAEDMMMELSKRAKKIIWLNPDKKFSTFAQILSDDCTMLCCNTLEDLAKACASFSNN